MGILSLSFSSFFVFSCTFSFLFLLSLSRLLSLFLPLCSSESACTRLFASSSPHLWCAMAARSDELQLRWRGIPPISVCYRFSFALFFFHRAVMLLLQGEAEEVKTGYAAARLRQAHRWAFWVCTDGGELEVSGAEREKLCSHSLTVPYSENLS